MNYKFDIEKMTKEFNNANYAIGGYNCKIEDMDVYKTNEQMSEMVKVLMTEKEFIRETSLQIIDRKDWNIVS